MVTVEDFSRLVSGIYDAAVTPEHWLVAIAEVSRAVGATGGGMLIADGPPAEVVALPQVQQAYLGAHGAGELRRRSLQ